MENLIGLITFTLGISVANERLVAISKTIVPWLAQEPLLSSGLIDHAKEKKRVLILQIASVISAFFTTSLLAFSLGDINQICAGNDGKNCYASWLLALLSLGGSAFWTNILGYLNAVKDIKKQERASNQLDLARKAQDMHIKVSEISAV